MDRKIFWIAALLLCSFFSKADTLPTVIKGSCPEYAGQIITVYKLADFITKKPELLSIDTVSKQGGFILSYHQTEPLLISVPLGIYNAILFTEPGKTLLYAEPNDYAQDANPYQ